MAATTNAAAPPRQLSQKEADIQMMLAADVHLGTKNCDFQMERYIFKRRNDGAQYGFDLLWCGFGIRMVLQMRGTIRPGLKWDVMVDLFFYREPEAAKQQEEEEAPAGDYAITDYNPGAIAADGQWPGTIDQSWTDAVPQPIPAVPGVNWGAPPSTDAPVAGDWGEAVPPPQQIPLPSSGVESVQASGWD
ncbi:hypothetical protein LR48_Vigan11g005200 [Vigna angularis]|uniref:40S ribosomal protein SA C-terminal domain-containing protein n=1 Tax=Phaseolus angularis TaxID=3914 RepID=A0A0L9VPQ1_PHAAN|nr:hypothetical protein LR48_Vigan11g005200 [Vigna angularis]